MRKLAMSEKSLASKGENYANAFKALNAAEKYTNSLDGAMGIITKYWSKGYDKVVLSMGLEWNGEPIVKPGVLAKYVKNIVKGEGLNPLMQVEVTDKKGNKSLALGVYGSKNLEDKSVDAVIDAKGRETYPYIMTTDEKGKEVPVKVDAIKPITKWTPKVVFDFVLQNYALNDGQVPFTESDYLASVAPKCPTIPSAAEELRA